MVLDIIFRCCASVDSFHGTTRPLRMPKSQLILGCLSSLLRAALQAQTADPELDLNFTVVDDHSDMATQNSIREQLEKSSLKYQMISLEGSGNGASLTRTFTLGLNQGRGLIYFVEDDYLHAPSCLTEMLAAWKFLSEETKKEVVIHPYDCPDRYTMLTPSYILLRPERYWRSIRHTTGTFMLHYKTLGQFWSLFEKFTRYGVDPAVCEDNTINIVYREVPCFSPMPTLALHLQSLGHISPFVSLDHWWKEYGEPSVKPRGDAQMPSPDPR